MITIFKKILLEILYLGSYDVVPTKPESNFKAWWQLVLKAAVSLPKVS